MNLFVQRGPVTKYSVRVKIWSGRTKYASIFGPPPPQTVLLVAHAFRSVKARVTASETAREMCADENEDLVEKACLYLFDGRYPEGSTSNDKRVIKRKAATLTLRDGEVFYKKKTQKEFNWAKGKYIRCALCMASMH